MKQVIDEYLCKSDKSGLNLSSDSEEFTYAVIIDDLSDNEQTKLSNIL